MPMWPSRQLQMLHHNEWQSLSTYWPLPLLLEALNQKRQQNAEYDNRSYAAASHHQTPDEIQNIQHNLPPDQFIFYHLSKRNSQIRNVKPQIKRPSRARTRTARIIRGKFIKINTAPQRSAIARIRLAITFMASII